MLGNDIVDLTQADADLQQIHPRFMRRVCSPCEQTFLTCCKHSELTRWLWLHWAAKEAAYKALQRLQPALPFQPAKFIFDPTQKKVGYKSYTFICDIMAKKTQYIHVTAHLVRPAPHSANQIEHTSQLTNMQTVGKTTKTGIYAKQELDLNTLGPKPTCEAHYESLLVRQALCQELASTLTCPPQAIRITHNASFAVRTGGAAEHIPYVFVAGCLAPIILSLSHHGKYLAYAYYIKNGL